MCIVCDDEQFYKTVETAVRMNMTVFCDVARCSLVEYEVPSSHGGEYEAQNLLGCTAVFLIECRPTFQRCCLRHQGDDLVTETSVDTQLRTRQYEYIPEDSEIVS
jgi:hypothetical protein